MLRFAEYQTDAIDLGIEFYGYEDCRANYAFGPTIRKYYVIHYITKGKGTFHYQGQVHELQAGDFFLLKPNELTYYQADSQDPWSYYWFGISGTKAQDYFSLSTLGETGVLHQGPHTDILQEIIQTAIDTAQTLHKDPLHHLLLLSSMYRFLFYLHSYFPNKEKPEIHPSQKLYYSTKKIIDTQYDDLKLSISSIAQSLNVNRSYLTSVFKDYHQISPKEYLLKVRMTRACELLKHSQEPIKIIAYSVGYQDPLHFSKAFKKYYQQSPREYREERQDTTLP